MSHKSDEVEEGGNAVAELSRGESAESAMKREEFGGGQPIVEAEVFREEADLATNRDTRKGLMEVLLPAPFGPRKPKISPRRTWRERPRTATFEPKTLLRPWVSMARWSVGARGSSES